MAGNTYLRNDLLPFGRIGFGRLSCEAEAGCKRTGCRHHHTKFHKTALKIVCVRTLYSQASVD